MASASAGVNPPCPIAIRYIAAPKTRSAESAAVLISVDPEVALDLLSQCFSFKTALLIALSRSGTAGDES
jgi:hypothetical protein